MGKEFTKEHTRAIKGLAIVMIYVVHLFYSADISGGMEVKFVFFDMVQVISFARNFCKISVAIFIFLTAYGMTCKYNKLVKTKLDMIKIAVHQYTGIIIPFVFVFLLANIACCFTDGYKPWQVYGMNGTGIFNFLIDGMGLETL